MPKKFRLKIIEGNVEEDPIIRRDTALFGFEFEIRIIKKAMWQQETYLKIDEKYAYCILIEIRLRGNRQLVNITMGERVPG